VFSGREKLTNKSFFMILEFKSKKKKHSMVYSYVYIIILMLLPLAAVLIKKGYFFLVFIVGGIVLLLRLHKNRNNVPQVITLNTDNDILKALTIDGREFECELKDISYSAGGYLISPDEINWIRLRKDITLFGLIYLENYQEFKEIIFKNCAYNHSFKSRKRG
jgi:hypothetical protein